MTYSRAHHHILPSQCIHLRQCQIDVNTLLQPSVQVAIASFCQICGESPQPHLTGEPICSPSFTMHLGVDIYAEYAEIYPYFSLAP